MHVDCEHRAGQPQTPWPNSHANWPLRLVSVVALLLLTPGLTVGIVSAAATPQTPHTCGLASGGAWSHTPRAPSQSRVRAPQIVLTRTHGTAGSKIVVTGTGWPVGATAMVAARANGQPLAGQVNPGVAVAPDGSFTSTLAAPGSICTFIPQVGTIIQVVAQTTNPPLSASADFIYDVLPPTLDVPASGGVISQAVESLAIRGEHWGTGTTVILWATTPSTAANSRDAWRPPDGVPTVHLTADAQGQLTGEIPILPALFPLRPGDVFGVAASASTSAYGEVITYLPNAYRVGVALTPTIVLDRGTVASGEILRVSGKHWWPGDLVRLLYCPNVAGIAGKPSVRCNPATSVALGTTRVDQQGNFAAHVAVAATLPASRGVVEATVSGAFDDPYTASQSLRITAASGLSAWLNSSGVGPAAPLLALALLALAATLVALLWLMRRRAALAGSRQ
jgi:hypothetical protein